MKVIGKRKWLTWEDTFQRRKEVRVDVYLGSELKAELEARAEGFGLALSPFVREIAREYVNTHPRHQRPQEDTK